MNSLLITLVESDPFCGTESETVVAHLTKLNDIGTLFTHEEKIRHYYILKLFPFSLKGDAKAWYNMLGNVACNFKKIPMLTQDLSRRCIATRGGECVHVPS